MMIALVRRPSWSQAELARECGVTPRTLRMRIRELGEADMPIERDAAGSQVVWSVHRGWFPGGTFVADADLRAVVRALNRAPDTAGRQRALGLLGQATKAGAPAPPSDERTLVAVEDACREHQVVEVDYQSAGRDEVERRHLSVHRVFHGDRVRILATCHRTNELRFFRAERIKRIQRAPAHKFRAAPVQELDRWVSESINWYRTSAPATMHRFVVRLPEARWVRANLPVGTFVESPATDGVRFEARTSGLDPLARYVVGLGEAAYAETLELRHAVQRIARGALATKKRPRKARSTK
jgi:predicted DNA-binding transcriptional regulator YafY